MLRNILLLMIPLMLAVTITGIPVENSGVNDTSKNGTDPGKTNNATDSTNTAASNNPKQNGTDVIAIKVPPVEKGGTPRPLLVIYNDDKTPNTTTETPESKKQDTVSPVTPTKTSDVPTSNPKNNDTTDVPKKEPSEDSPQRPVLIVYSRNPNETKNVPNTDAPTNNDVTPSPKPGKNDTPIVTNKTPSGEKDSPPRPILFIYSNDNPNITKTAPEAGTEAPPPDKKKPDETIPLNFLRGYNCPKRNGFFQFPDKCDAYIVCKDYVPLSYLCPEGLHFNPKAKRQRYLCDDPSVAKCIKKPDTPKTEDKKKPVAKVPPGERDDIRRPILFIKSDSTSARPDTSTDLPANLLLGYSCPRRKGFFSYPGKCDVYIICENYTPLTYICPDGLQFNPNAKSPELVCDDPSVVKCKAEDKFTNREPITAKQRPITYRQPWSNMDGFSCPTPNGYFRLTEQCDEYIECRVYTPLRYMCPEGLYFNPDALWTEYPCVDPSLVVSRCRT